MGGKLIRKIKEKKGYTIILAMFAILVIMSALTYAVIRYKYNKDMLVDKPINTEDTTKASDGNLDSSEDSQTDYGQESNIVNVLLVGVDSRGVFDDSRTDSIIVASVDPILKKVKLTSFMRDMYVDIPGKGYNKINAAFQLGGVELLEKTIKYNFGINVSDYVAIDFQGFQELIDTLGGIELDVKDYEVKEINKYIEEVNGNNSTLIKSPGMQDLNGQQALSYCRIRKVGNNDYERTERQRKVLSLLVSKIKDTKVTSYLRLYSVISSYVKTDIPFESMLKLVYTVYKFGDSSTDSLRLPVDGYYKDTSINDEAVLIPQLQYNAVQLYKFIYNTEPLKLNIPDNSKIYNEDEESKKENITQPTQQQTTVSSTPLNNTTGNNGTTTPGSGRKDGNNTTNQPSDSTGGNQQGLSTQIPVPTATP